MRWLRIILPLLLATTPTLAWETRDGSEIGGKLDSFDFDSKELVFDDPAQPESTRVAFNDLSMRSRQHFLFSPVYHRSFPGDSLWPAEKKKLLLISAVSVVVPLFLGFWISGALIARKLNPVHALLGFAGSWIIGSVLVTIYLILSARFDGNTSLLWAGFIVAAIFLSILVSAVYSCSTIKGFAIFFSHLFVGVCVALILLATTNLLLPEASRDELWNKLVFRPVGLSPPAT
ncbi:MAG: hypothetical protein HRU46_01345 [Verrucomicrobiales bacterium]|nr:hypothetical protein [Verrucomicrobiales bacterium]